jgi:hypothetical protein
LLALCVAIVVHAATFTSYSMSPSNPLFWILHIGIFPLFIPMVFGLRKWSQTQTGPFGFKSSRLRWRELLVYFPTWVPKAVVILFVYVMINFLLAVSHLPAGGHASAAAMQSMDPEQGRYLVRAFSGHWLVFYTAPTLYYLFVPSEIPAASGLGPPTGPSLR